MLRVVFCTLICIKPLWALWLEKNRPGALPFLSTQVSNSKSGMVGGYSTYDLSQPDKYEDLEHLIQMSLDYVQGQDQGNFSNPNVTKYKVHKLIAIREAIYQVVSGFNYKAVFTVGERDCSSNHGKSNATNSPRQYHGCRINQNGQYDLQHIVQLAMDNAQNSEQANTSLSNGTPFKFHKLINIKEATSQVVNGVNYQVLFTVGERDCDSQDHGHDDDFGASSYIRCDNKGASYRGCRVMKNGQLGKCYFKIYSQPFNGVLTVKEYTCVERDSQEAA